MSVFVHTSHPQVHRSVHGSPTLAHLHLVHFPFEEQWHLIYSEQALAASGCVIHKGCHFLSIFSQPQALGSGIGFVAFEAVVHMPAWYATLFMCCGNASCVGGRFSRFRPFLQNSSRRASFTVSRTLVLS